MRLKFFQQALICSVFSGCIAVPSPPAVLSYPNVRVAARNAAYVLANQIGQVDGGQGVIWVSPVINLHSGEITASGREMEVLLSLDLKTLLGNTIVENLVSKEVVLSQWVVSSTVQFEKPETGKLDESWFKIDITAINPSGESLPGVSLRVNAHQFDSTPSRFFRDAPLVLTGNFHHIRQEFNKGKNSNLSQEIRNSYLATESLLKNAVYKYESGDFEKSIDIFEKVISSDPNNLTALSGRYQSLIEIGDMLKSESALSDLISVAIKQGNISLKFLFQVRSDEFRDDLEVTHRYQSWLRQIATNIYASKMCLNIFGHASRTGSFAYNLQLSQSRANNVKNHLVKYVPELKDRVRAEGRSYQDNIVGSGSDDAKDAIDRRVSFTLATCT